MKSFREYIKEMADFSELPSRYVFHETAIVSLIGILNDGRICTPKVRNGLEGEDIDMDADVDEDDMFVQGRDEIYTTVNKTKEDADFYYGVNANECLIVIDVGSLPEKGKYEPDVEGGLYTLNYCIPVGHFVEIVCYTNKRIATVKKLCDKLNIKMSKMRRKDILAKYINMRSEQGK
jgi:hypothetical protein